MASYAATVSGTASNLIDASHPYFLHNSDNPGTPIVTQLLTEQNYRQWSRAITVALSTKMKIGFINGTLVKPASNSPNYAMWSRCNDMVLSWLLNSISVEIRNSVNYFSTAKEIWDDLATRFSQSNMPRVFQLRKEIASVNQGNLSITTYFTRIKTLIAEIDNFSPLPRCICTNANCTCENARRIDEYEHVMKLSQFLMGLNDQYTAVRGQMLMMKPIPSLNQAYSLLLQEESQRDFAKLAHTPVGDNMAMNVKFQGAAKSRNNTGAYAGAKKPPDTNSFCDYSQNSGHTRDKCFCLHGYPD
ncbi:hypothetical protein DCAR_0520086 [Daucus carota subsp. sativus]|uniref:Retrotransposon Copia-like N-terminal domain-containing protein n=1 Tax=Daucus carota subsp. sativus TaxID=79200 RepID=A0AAF1B1R5_DAUCS|nr:hypothetical protein DCAR_0520086 [Daucus carota subsp. sativus]